MPLSLLKTTDHVKTSRLKRVCQRIESYISKAGLSARASTAVSEKTSADLPRQMQDEVAGRLEAWIATFESADVLPINGKGNEKFLQNFLKTMSYKIDSGFLTTIRDGDCVEIYEFINDNTGAVQTWRNWRFLELCSYDILTLSVTPMDQLFFREPKFRDAINEMCVDLIPNPRTKMCEVEPHVLVEVKEQHNRQFRIENKFITPVFNTNDRVVGFACTIQATPLGSLYADSNVVPIWN